MVFVQPLFLVLLIPIAATAVFVMSRGGEATEVPSTRFWAVDSPQVGSRWRWGRLPAWVILALAAAAAAVFAAAGPVMGGRWERPVTAVVDRGVTMSASDAAGGQTRLRSALENLSAAAERHGLSVRRVVLVPGGLAESDDLTSMTALEATPFETAEQLRQTILAESRYSDIPVAVLTDRAADTSAERDIVIPPRRADRHRPNVGIVHLAADTATPRVLVRVRADGAVAGAVLRVSSGGATAERTIDLPAGATRDVILDLPRFDEAIEARITAAGDVLPADDGAWLARAWRWPRVEARSPLGPDLARMIEVYGRRRPSDGRSPVVEVSNDVAPDGAGVWVRDPDDGGPAAGEVRLSGPVGRDVDWPEVLRDARVAPEPEASWRPIVAASGRTLLAERDVPARQVLVNFASPTLARRADFVVLFGQIFDSFAAGGAAGSGWSAGAVTDLRAGWRLTSPPLVGVSPSPGLYRDAAGLLRAVNPVEVPLAEIAESEWPARVAALPAVRVGGWRCGRTLAVVAALLLLGSTVAGRFARPWSGTSRGSAALA